MTDINRTLSDMETIQITQTIIYRKNLQQ
jgi:hypothetical protein